MAGIADLMTAFTGGSRLEGAAYANQANRILDAQNKQSMMDKRVLEANLLKDQMRARGNLERNPGNLDQTTLFAVLSELAPQLKAGKEGIGVDQTNQAQAQAIQIAEKLQAQGGDPIDVMNAFIGSGEGKMLAPTNVRVNDQAAADIGYSQSQANERDAMAGFNTARAENVGVVPPGELAPIVMDALTGDDSKMLRKYPDEIPVTYDNPGLFTGDTTENLPFDDPRAQEAWGNMSEGQQAALIKDLRAAFSQWRVENIRNDPSLKDAQYAIGKFQQMQGQPIKPTREQLYATRKPDPSDFADVAAGKTTPEEFEAYFGVPYGLAGRQ